MYNIVQYKNIRSRKSAHLHHRSIQYTAHKKITHAEPPNNASDANSSTIETPPFSFCTLSVRLIVPHKSCSFDVGRHLVLLAWVSGLLLQAFLLQPGLLEPLSADHLLVLGHHFVAVARYLVALFGARPKAVDGKSVVEVRSEVEHDANWEHDIHAKLHWSAQLPEEGSVSSDSRTLKTSRFNPAIVAKYSWVAVLDVMRRRR